MDSDFMNNLSNMFNSGNIPSEFKTMLNNFKSNSENTSNTNNSNSSNTFSNENSENTNDSNNNNSINPEMLKNIMNMFNNSNNSNNNSSDSNSTSNAPNIDINTLLKMKSIMDKINTNKNDPRSNLLLSLKPYLKESRKSKVEQYVQLFNMTKVIDAFNQNGGENAK